MTFPLPALSNLSSAIRSTIPPKPFVELISANGKKTFAVHNCDWDGDGKAEDAYVKLLYGATNGGSRVELTAFSSKDQKWIAIPVTSSDGSGGSSWDETGIAKCDIPINGKFDGMNDRFYFNFEGWGSGNIGNFEYLYATPFVDPKSLQAVNPKIELPKAKNAGFSTKAKAEIKNTRIDGTGDKVHDAFQVSENGFIMDYLTKNYVQMCPVARGEKLSYQAYEQIPATDGGENRTVNSYRLNSNTDYSKKIYTPQKVEFTSVD